MQTIKSGLYCIMFFSVSFSFSSQFSIQIYNLTLRNVHFVNNNIFFYERMNTNLFQFVFYVSIYIYNHSCYNINICTYIFEYIKSILCVLLIGFIYLDALKHFKMYAFYLFGKLK